ncbi:hypothetical protein TNCV_4083061 [Trichonephila clavipes]|nr:hypothetical protein TNCV_4083061 [Trichonephila clavipes]
MLNGCVSAHLLIPGKLLTLKLYLSFVENVIQRRNNKKYEIAVIIIKDLPPAWNRLGLIVFLRVSKIIECYDTLTLWGWGFQSFDAEGHLRERFCYEARMYRAYSKRVGTRLRKLKSRNKGLGGKKFSKAEYQTLRLGAYIAVVQFNNGFQGLISILNEMGIVSGYYTIRGQKIFDNERIADSKRHSPPTAKPAEENLGPFEKKKET